MATQDSLILDERFSLPVKSSSRRRTIDVKAIALMLFRTCNGIALSLPFVFKTVCELGDFLHLKNHRHLRSFPKWEINWWYTFSKQLRYIYTYEQPLKDFKSLQKIVRAEYPMEILVICTNMIINVWKDHKIMYDFTKLAYCSYWLTVWSVQPNQTENPRFE